MPIRGWRRNPHEVRDEGIEDEIHRNHTQQLPSFLTERNVQICDRENCRKKGQDCSSSKKDECVFAWRVADPAKPTNQEQVNKDCGRESKAEFSSVLFRGLERWSEQGPQGASDICYPEPQK